jgi:hypothetical protein
LLIQPDRASPAWRAEVRIRIPSGTAKWRA